MCTTHDDNIMNIIAVHAESGIVSEDPGDDTVSTTSNNDASLKQRKH